jgi:hypothetical protein
MENKVNTKQNLEKIKENLLNENFRKEFNKHLLSYLDARNRDTNAHYYKILKMLQETGMNKQEAEEFFKDLRVKNKNLILNLQELQQKEKELTEKWRKERLNLLTNPLNAKAFLGVIVNEIQDTYNTLQKVANELIIKKANDKEFLNKINEINKTLNLDEIKTWDEITVNFIVNNLNKATEKIKNLAADVITETINLIKFKNFKKEFEKNNRKDFVLNELFNLKKQQILDKEKTELNKKINETIEKAKKRELSADELLYEYKKLKEEKENIDKKQEKLNENEKNIDDDDILIDDEQAEKIDVNDLDTQLDFCTQAVFNSIENENLDEKTLNFLVLSEYIYSYNNNNIKDLYNKFKDTLSKNEFISAYILTNAAMHSDINDNVFNEIEQKTLKNIDVVKIAEQIKAENPQYKEISQDIEKELSEKEKTIDKEKDKELEFNNIKKTKKAPSIDF